MNSVNYRPRRSFDPSRSVQYGDPTYSPGQLVRYSPKYGYSRLYNFPFIGSQWLPRMGSVVIRIQGVVSSRHLADSSAQAAFGVVFGKRSPRNISGVLDQSLAQTKHRALLEALRRTLAAVTEMRQNDELDPRWKEIIIMVDSINISTGLNRWIWGWEEHNYFRGDGRAVKHCGVLQELHNTLLNMESQLSISIRFWKVRRNDVYQASALAKAALEATPIE